MPPSRVEQHVRLGNLGLDHLETVVVDEADLMCTYMYAEAIQKLWKRMPEHYQLFVASATMSQDLSKINKILFRDDESVLHNTVLLRLKEQPLPPLSTVAFRHPAGRV